MSGAAVLSVGLVGTFALPAYATSPEAEGGPSGAPAQTLTAPDIDAEFDDLSVLEAVSDIDEEPAPEPEPESEPEVGAAAQDEAPQTTSDVPAGEGAEGLAAAALAQLGVGQDCTDLVQNSLAAIGMTTRRDEGGFDHGVGSFYQYGTTVTSGDYAVGDILVYGGHVAIYIGNGQAVGGGWGSPGTTAIHGVNASGTPTVVRIG